MGSKSGKIQSGTANLPALERVEKLPHTYNGRNVVSTPAPSFFILADNVDNHKSLKEFEFWTHPPLTTELAALECLNNRCIML